MTVDDIDGHRAPPACFEGRWLAPDGGVHRIVQRDHALELDSLVDDTASLHGRGQVIDGVAVIDVVDALGNCARLEVGPAADGSRLQGSYAGPMGRTAIRLTRQP